MNSLAAAYSQWNALLCKLVLYRLTWTLGGIINTRGVNLC